MTMDFLQTYDGVINILTGIAFVYFAAFTYGYRKNSGQRRRLLFLLTLVGSGLTPS